MIPVLKLTTTQNKQNIHKHAASNTVVVVVLAVVVVVTVQVDSLIGSSYMCKVQHNMRKK